MEWFSTLSLALGSAWTSGINLYATVAVLGVLQKFGLAKLPGGLDTLDNWWIIGFAAGLYIVEFFADKFPYVDSVWDVIHTFIRVPAGAIVAYAATNHLDSSIVVPATLVGGGLAFASHGTKAAASDRRQPLARARLELGAFGRRGRDRVRGRFARRFRPRSDRRGARAVRSIFCLVRAEGVSCVTQNVPCRRQVLSRRGL